MSFKQKGTRVGAFLLALLFLVTSISLSALVLWEAFKGPVTPEKGLEQKPEFCGPAAQVSGEVKAAPEIFKASGPIAQLEKIDLVTGNGQEVKPGDCITVKYLGTLAQSGEKFDGNFDQPTLFKIVIGQGGVIAGWDQGLIGMKAGGLRRLLIPAELAYGDQSPSPSIPANSDLVFVVELISLENPPE